MKIGIYNPYLDSLGGGERYILTIAEHWSKKHDVDIFWDDPDTLNRAGKQFGMDVSRIRVVKNIFTSASIFQKLTQTRTYDCILFVSDGSVPSSLARTNIIHFQVPFKRVHLALWKKLMYKLIIVNSEFTKLNLDNTLTIPRTVIYPPVCQASVGNAKKTKTILSVGRFAGLYNAKKHDVLIAAFRDMYADNLLKDWRLVIAGSLLDSDKADFDHLRHIAAGIPVEFYPNCYLKTLQSLYETSTLYWHATGFGESSPEYMEHFGISSVEAMSAGCVPLSYDGGGQPEIIQNGISGFLWSSVVELKSKTRELLENEILLQTMRGQAILRSTDFSRQRFTDAFDGILHDLQ